MLKTLSNVTSFIYGWQSLFMGSSSLSQGHFQHNRGADRDRTLRLLDGNLFCFAKQKVKGNCCNVSSSGRRAPGGINLIIKQYRHGLTHLILLFEYTETHSRHIFRIFLTQAGISYKKHKDRSWGLI